MQRAKYLLANWKMYTTTVEAVALFAQIQQGLRARAGADRTLPLSIICPPYLSLVLIRALIDHDLARLGAQNCHWMAEGPCTGEISPAMVREVADYVLLGHSERRAAGETDEMIARKVRAAAEAGLIPVLFVGEDERTRSAVSQSQSRLVAGLQDFDTERHRVLVVYEPTWAVGAEQPADVTYVAEVVGGLKDQMVELGIASPEVIYGGTVTAENIHRFAEIDNLDGVGATRASLSAKDFLCLLDQLTQAA